MCDDKARWWPEWCEYTLNDNSILVDGTRMLFSPKQTPNLTKYMLWSDSVHLIDSKYFIHGPFSYDAHDEYIHHNQHVALTHWDLYSLSITNLVSFPQYSLPKQLANLPRKREKNNFQDFTYIIMYN